MNGILVIDKPAGMTSHDVVQRVRRVTCERSVGHLGTLDPMATGVLPLLLGRFTRLAQFFGEADKEYEGMIRFGTATDTYDADGEPIGTASRESFTREEFDAAIAKLTGEIEQMPPPFSAKKIAGVPAYKLARKGEAPTLKAVQVHVKHFKAGLPAGYVASDNVYYVKHKEKALEIGFRVTVSAGTYVRSLAHDLGQMLGCGAHLASLRRTRSGEFSIGSAISLDAFSNTPREDLPNLFVPAANILSGMPNVVLRSEETLRIRHGNSTNLAVLGPADYVKVFDGTELIAIARRVAGTLFQPKVVLV